MSKEKTLKELRAQLEALENEVKTEVADAEVRTVEVAEDKEAMELRGVEQFLKGDMSRLSFTSTEAFILLNPNFPQSVKDADGIERLITDNSAGPIPDYWEFLTELPSYFFV